MTAIFNAETKPTKPLWEAAACQHCTCAVIRLTDGTWSHVADYVVRDANHAPTPILESILPGG